MECQGLYLYGFARAAAVRGMELAGIASGEPVAVLTDRQVAAIYSRVPVAEFEAALAPGETPDPEWIIPRACRHEQILESVMERSTVLPVRFGAVFSSSEALAEFCSLHYGTILRFLVDMEGKEEWAIKLLVDADRLADGLLESEPGLASRKDQLSQAPGTRYFQEKRLRNEARSHARRVSKTLSIALQGMLEDSGWAIQMLPARSAAGSATTLLLHAAVLLPATELERLEKLTAGAIAPHPSSGVWLERTGPWPPSHFCPVLEVATPCQFDPTP